MKKLARKIKKTIELEGYMVTLGSLQERKMTKTGISYKSIKITVRQNDYSVSVQINTDDDVLAEDRRKFEYKKASDMLLDTEDEDELI